jgi:predicted secreted Zn-dependent protease
MSVPCWRLLAVSCFALGSSVVHADEAEIVYYDVVGNSARELRHEMDAKGPLGEDGKRFDGHTDWHVTWSYRYAPAADGCRFTELGVTVTATITLPRWTAADEASNKLVEKWQKYLSALRVHENGHYAHGVSAAEEIRALPQSIRASDNCSTLAMQFDSQAASILEKFKAADAAYDTDTKHGRTQGAAFP